MKTCIWIFLLVIILILEAKSEEEDECWDNYKKKHGGSFRNNAHENRRRRQFKKDYAAIKEHEKQGKPYQIGINKFTSMDEDEMAAYKGYFPPPEDDILVVESRGLIDMSDGSRLPSVDLRTHPCLPPVRDQGSCGCCYAFSSMASLSHGLCLQTGVNVPLSPQDVVDCSIYNGNLGCLGGNMYNSFKYVAAYGISFDSCYQYKIAAGTCKRSCESALTLAGFIIQIIRVAKKDEPSIERALTSGYALSTAMDSRGIKMYKGGMYYNSLCNGSMVDHAVFLVGYDKDCWIIQNSWGPTWGESGCIRVNRSCDCGITSYVIYPIFVGLK